MDRMPVEILNKIISNVHGTDLYELSKVNKVFRYLCDQKVCAINLIPIVEQQEKIENNYKLFDRSYVHYDDMTKNVNALLIHNYGYRLYYGCYDPYGSFSNDDPYARFLSAITI